MIATGLNRRAVYCAKSRSDWLIWAKPRLESYASEEALHHEHRER